MFLVQISLHYIFCSDLRTPGPRDGLLLLFFFFFFLHESREKMEEDDSRRYGIPAAVQHSPWGAAPVTQIMGTQVGVYNSSVVKPCYIVVNTTS